MREFTNHAERALERLNETRVRGTEGETEKCKILWIVFRLLYGSRSLPLSIQQIADLGKIGLEDAISRVGELEEQRLVAIHTPDGQMSPPGVFASPADSSYKDRVIIRGEEVIHGPDLLVSLTNGGFGCALSECRWVEPLIRESLTTERPGDIDD